MSVIKVEHFGGPEVLSLIDEPDQPVGDGQVQIDVKASGINFADVAARAGKYPGVPSAPFYPGLEVAGVVREVGGGVDGFDVGDRVMAFVPNRGYATTATIDVARVVKVPDSLDFGEASALLVQGLTAHFLLLHGKVKQGSSVLISSASGGLGSLAVQFARLLGAGKIIGLASQKKHERLMELGADAAIDYTKPGWSQEVLDATGGDGVNAYLDSSGDLAGEGFNALGAGSHWLIYGSQASTGQPLVAQRLGVMIGKSISLRGYSVYFDYANFGGALTQLLDWAASGKLRIDVESFPLSQAGEAHKAIEDRKTAGKVVLVP